MDIHEVSLVRERFLPQIRVLTEALRQCGTDAHVFVIPKEPAWPTFFVGPDGREGICRGINTRSADDAYRTATQQRRSDVAEASVRPPK